MKPQKYPKTRSLKEHEITAIHKRQVNDDGRKNVQHVYLVWRCPGMTWGKLSKKHGHYGWTNAIQDWMPNLS